MLVAFDFDNVLVDADPYVQLGEQHGVSEEVASLLDGVSNREFAFEQGLQSVADQLEGLRLEDAEPGIDRLEVRPAAVALLDALHDADHDVAVISDAPERAVSVCLDASQVSPEAVVTNTLGTDKGAFDGELSGPVLDDGKGEILNRVAAERGFEPDEVIAVGDDRRDLPMIQAAGLGVGVDPEPTVATQCDLVVPSVGRLEGHLESRNLL